MLYCFEDPNHHQRQKQKGHIEKCDFGLRHIQNLDFIGEKEVSIYDKENEIEEMIVDVKPENLVGLSLVKTTQSQKDENGDESHCGIENL